MRTKRGQMQISFGMIFSIIIIIAVLVVSGYAIMQFMSLSNCTTLGLYYSDLQEGVNEAWAAPSSKSVFSGTVPASVEYICFGNLTLNARSADRERLNALKTTHRFTTKDNVFMYPVDSACSKEYSKEYIEHAYMDSFFCSQTLGGKVKVTISKDATDTLARVTP